MVSTARLRRPKILVAGAGVVLFAAAFSLPPVQGLAQDFLSIFRVKTIKPVTVTPLAQRPSLHPEEFLTVTTDKQGESHTYASLGDATAAGVSLRVPSQLPAGVSATPAKITVTAGSQTTVKVDRTKAAAALATAGIGGITLDPQIDNAEFRVSIPTVIVLSYGDGLSVAQTGSPEVIGPPGLDYDQLRKQALTVLGSYAPDTAAQLGAIGDWRSTLPIPVGPNMPKSDVTVDGVSGIMIADPNGATGHTALLWQKNGMVYGVWGTATAADLLAAGNSLH